RQRRSDGLRWRDRTQAVAAGARGVALTMTHVLLVVLLALICLGGLAPVALGLPGLWVISLAVIGYGAITHFATVGVWTIVTVLALAGLGELFEFWLGYGLTRKYGGSKRAGWGALVGGIVGAAI